MQTASSQAGASHGYEGAKYAAGGGASTLYTAHGNRVVQVMPMFKSELNELTLLTEAAMRATSKRATAFTVGVTFVLETITIVATGNSFPSWFLGLCGIFGLGGILAGVVIHFCNVNKSEEALKDFWTRLEKSFTPAEGVAPLNDKP